MKVSLFLKKLEQPSFFSYYHSIRFVLNDRYPLLFFSLLLQKLKRCFNGTVEHLDLDLRERQQILSKLEMPDLLGSSNYYWMGDLSGLSIKKKKYWLGYLSSYQGEHRIGFCVNKEDYNLGGTRCLRIVVDDDKIDKIGFEQLAHFFEMVSPSTIKKVSKQFFSYETTFDLDKACLLLHYISVVGNNVQQFCDEWLPVLLDSEESLFKVSDYFLRKHAKNFFKLWAKVQNRYPDVFWSSFWSDILWRAYHYVQAMRRGNHAEAKKIGYRLPFFFLKWDWKKADLQELKQAHLSLYDIDHKLKNGIGSYSLELLYMKFFLGQFSSSGNSNNRRGTISVH